MYVREFSVFRKTTNFGRIKKKQNVLNLRCRIFLPTFFTYCHFATFELFELSTVSMDQTHPSTFFKRRVCKLQCGKFKIKTAKLKLKQGCQSFLVTYQNWEKYTNGLCFDKIIYISIILKTKDLYY
jgi:hypothetical protein